MEWGDLISGGLTILGSVFSGGITGVIGTVVTKFFDLRQRAQDIEVLNIQNTHELAKMDKHADIARIEAEGAFAVADANARGLTEQADGAAFAASFKMEPKRYAADASFPDRWYGRVLQAVTSTMMFFLDFFRGLMRPGLTTYLAVVCTLIWWTLLGLLDRYGINIPADKLVQAVFLGFATLLYMFTACGMWWFGTRPKQKAPTIPAV